MLLSSPLPGKKHYIFSFSVISTNNTIKNKIIKFSNNQKRSRLKDCLVFINDLLSYTNELLIMNIN